MGKGYIHFLTLIVSLLTFALLVVSQFQIHRLRADRDEAVKQLMLYMDRKTREIREGSRKDCP